MPYIQVQGQTVGILPSIRSTSKGTAVSMMKIQTWGTHVDSAHICHHTVDVDGTLEVDGRDTLSHPLDVGVRDDDIGDYASIHD